MILKMCTLLRVSKHIISLERAKKTFEFVHFNQISIEAIHKNPR